MFRLILCVAALAAGRARPATSTAGGTSGTFSMVGQLALAVVVGVGVAAVSASAGTAAFHGANGRVAFSSNRSGQSEIVVADADGSNRTPLGAQGASPRWSPDGSRIAFSST